MFEELYKLEGLERIKAIDNMTIDERDEVCESFKSCDLCPFALIYNSRPYCAETSFLQFRVKQLIAKGGKFKTLEEVQNEKNT